MPPEDNHIHADEIYKNGDNHEMEAPPKTF